MIEAKVNALHNLVIIFNKKEQKEITFCSEKVFSYYTSKLSENF